MAEDKKEIKITYETLYELMRREKGRDELQKLDESFYLDLLDYLKEKNNLLEEVKQKTDIFSTSQKEKIEIQMKNIKKLVRDLFEKRESKIITMGMNKSRTRSDIIDTSHLLKEEKLFYQVLIDHLFLFREGLLHNVLAFNPPVSLTEKKIEAELRKSEEKKEMGEKKEEAKPEKKLVRFLGSVDRFVGEELETYGPFEEDDTAYLPVSLADVLMEKGKAEESKES